MAGHTRVAVGYNAQIAVDAKHRQPGAALPGRTAGSGAEQTSTRHAINFRKAPIADLPGLTLDRGWAEASRRLDRFAYPHHY
jgi:hypothetical protein